MVVSIEISFITENSKELHELMINNRSITKETLLNILAKSILEDTVYIEQVSSEIQSVRRSEDGLIGINHKDPSPLH